MLRLLAEDVGKDLDLVLDADSLTRRGRLWHRSPLPAIARLAKSLTSGHQPWRDSAAAICVATLRKSGPVISGFGPSG